MMMEEKDYMPSRHDIICGNGQLCFNHEGNRIFREVLSRHVEAYRKTESKVQKSLIVCNIIEDVQSRSEADNKTSVDDRRKTKFVRRSTSNKKPGLWYQIGDAAIKRKIGQTIREMIWRRDPVKRTTKSARRVQLYKAKSRRLCNLSRRDMIDEPMNEFSVPVLSLGTGGSAASRDVASSVGISDHQEHQEVTRLPPTVDVSLTSSSFAILLDALAGIALSSSSSYRLHERRRPNTTTPMSTPGEDEKKSVSIFSNTSCKLYKRRNAPDLLHPTEFEPISFPELLEDDFMSSPFFDAGKGSPADLPLPEDSWEFSNIFET